MVFIPKDPKIANLLERLTQNMAVTAKSDISRDLCKYKEIRKMRELDQILIGKDHRKNISIIMVKKPVIRKGRGFIL